MMVELVEQFPGRAVQAQFGVTPDRLSPALPVASALYVGQRLRQVVVRAGRANQAVCLLRSGLEL